MSFSEKIGRTTRQDGNEISTIRPNCMAWYGNYETALINELGIVILEGYETEQQAIEGHKKYCEMPTNELMKISPIG